MNNLENTLNNILLKLDKIISLLEKSQVETNFSHFDTLEKLDLISKTSLPNTWNTGYVPSCDNDILKNQIMD